MRDLREHEGLIKIAIPISVIFWIVFLLTVKCHSQQLQYLIVGFPQIPAPVVCADPANCTPEEQALIADRLAKLETLRGVERGMVAWFGGPYKETISQQGILYVKAGQLWTIGIIENNSKTRCDLLKAVYPGCVCWKKDDWSGWLASQGYVAVGGGE